VTQGLVQNWKELREFDTELHQTPKKFYRGHSKKKVERPFQKNALALNNNIPPGHSTNRKSKAGFRLW